jgi:hypothetical protein
MKNIIILIITISNFYNYYFCQNSSFFTKKDFTYNAIYISNNGDTISNEKITVKSLGKKWFAQRKLQDAICYIYNTDTSKYNQYTSPFEYNNQKQKKYYSKHHKFKLNKKETIGGYFYKEMFYIHPPRTNQYEILFYAWHPQIILTFLSDSITNSNNYANSSLPLKHKNFFLDSNRFLPCTKNELSKYYTYMGIPFFGTFRHTNTITNHPDIIINNKKTNALKVSVETKILKNKIKNIENFDGKVEAIFTLEYGFERILYEFENGIKIHFYLEYK